ncbi:hypothetical protein EJ070_26290 [Mesorhizobium sp. M1E.F.Ca.ET.045.02.1.1]|uniref:winged helix domain-containing protein n=1 Tax=Mesorhizobium sp. M1E.F.Ca.ET.045.02.1.1 TaxID=2493672 RepID=UPI000F75729E|nr:hypothetical protein [Mesorhizobium sp. M1E.F.Ca.ET.045.02.1.1]AZO23844.1 hypothetical protein EJ070_26290 [Mesorhizobium sp. M1E.F.Ca.ET.045.02.1.1]
MEAIAGDFPRAKSIPTTANKKFSITVKVEPDGRTVKLDGRAAWMLKQLIDAGKRGLTTLDLPAGIRVSHSVFLLRRAGFVISSPRESHGGPFPGTHSRYTLATPVTIIEDMATAA